MLTLTPLLTLTLTIACTAHYVHLCNCAIAKHNIHCSLQVQVHSTLSSFAKVPVQHFTLHQLLKQCLTNWPSLPARSRDPRLPQSRLHSSATLSANTLTQSHLTHEHRLQANTQTNWTLQNNILTHKLSQLTQQHCFYGEKAHRMRLVTIDKQVSKWSIIIFCGKFSIMRMNWHKTLGTGLK